VALQLIKRGIARVRPLHGGLDAWRSRGLPLVDFVADAQKPAITP
jgi:rhodanese-related sulfurtransferase